MPKLKNKFKKIVLIGLLFLFLTASSLLPFLTPSAKAQGAWYNQTFTDWYNRVYKSPDNDVFGERYTAAQVEWIIYGLFAFVLNKTGDAKLNACLMTEKDTTKCVPDLLRVLKFIGYSPDQTQTVANNSGGVKDVLSFIFLQDRPLSGITYFRNVGRNWHIIPEAKAQAAGFGFGALDPILPLWKASRNVAYGVLVLAILILSFMVMFRVKINPQTVITVQSAIPKVVVALILITFSYAIAGFAVDLMYAVIGFLSLILSNAYKDFGLNIDSPILSTTVSGFFNYMTIGPFGLGIFGALTVYGLLFVPVMIIGLLGAGPGGIIGTVSSLTLGAVLTVTGVLPLLLGIIAVILAILFLILAIRVIWMLLKAFVSVILLVAIAPLQIALGVVISGIGFGSWLKNLISNLAVFPLAGLFLSLSFLFLYMVVQQTLANIVPDPIKGLLGSSFKPPELKPGWPPLLSGTSSMLSLIYLGASLVVLGMLPRVSDLIKALIQGKPFEYGTAIGEAFGPIKTGAGFGTAAGIGVGAERLQRGYPVTSARYQTVGQIAQTLQKWAASGFKT